MSKVTELSHGTQKRLSWDQDPSLSDLEADLLATMSYYYLFIFVDNWESTGISAERNSREGKYTQCGQIKGRVRCLVLLPQPSSLHPNSLVLL